MSVDTSLGILHPTTKAVVTRLLAAMAAILLLMTVMVVGTVAVALHWASALPPVAQFLQAVGLSFLVV